MREHLGEFESLVWHWGLGEGSTCSHLSVFFVPTLNLKPVHISKCTICTANKSFTSYSCLIAMFCSLFNLILKPFPSSMQLKHVLQTLFCHPS